MGRLVRVPRSASSLDLPAGRFEEGLQSGMAGHPASATDNYLERIAKYVPAEVIAFFIFVNAILDQAIRTGGKSALMAGFPVMTIAAGALLAAVLLTPLFVWYVREDNDAWVVNAIVSTLIFPFWAYALGAVAFSDYRDGNLAVILLATVTVVSGLVSPRPRRRKGLREKPASQVETEARAAEGRVAESRLSDPRLSEARVSDLRGSDMRADTRMTDTTSGPSFSLS
jgi:hypothetical protein